MKYIIPETKLDKIVFQYLDLNLKDLNKKEPKYYEGIVFAYPDKKYGMLGYNTNGTLYIYFELIDEISNIFGLNEDDTKSIIGRWFNDRQQLEVTDTTNNPFGVSFGLGWV